MFSKGAWPFGQENQWFLTISPLGPRRAFLGGLEGFSWEGLAPKRVFVDRAMLFTWKSGADIPRPLKALNLIFL